MNVRVMTYNIRGGLGMDGRRSLERIAETVLSEQPDVICLQEVHQRLLWSRLEDQPRRLERLLRMPVMFRRSVSYGWGGFGLAIAARLPIAGINHYSLPSVRERRSVLEMALTCEGKVVTVFCTHWGLRVAERARQSAEMASRIAAAARPTIVCGDLNDWPQAECVTGLVTRTRMSDAGAEQNRLTFPSDHPKLRIDYVLYSEGLRLESVKTTESQASDHFPVVADFTV